MPRPHCPTAGIVAEGLAAMDELLVIGGGEEKSAGLILELRQQDIGQLPCELQVAAAPAGLQ